MTPLSSADLSVSASPVEEDEPVRWPKPQDHLADDAVVRLRTECARVLRELAVVAEREEVSIRHLERIFHVGHLGLRGAVRLGKETQVPVDVEVAVAQLHRLAGDSD